MDLCIRGLLPALGAFACATLLAGCGGEKTTAPGGTKVAGLSVQDLNGNSLAMFGKRSEASVLVFFRTDSAPGRKAAIVANDWKRKFGSAKLEAAAVALDEQADAVRVFARKNGIRISVAAMDRRQSKDATARFGLSGLPAVLLIGRNGQVVHRTIGYPSRPDMEADFKEDFEQRIGQLLKARR